VAKGLLEGRRATPSAIQGVDGDDNDDNDVKMGDNLDLDSCLAELGIEEAADDAPEPSVQISTALSGRLLHIAQPY
jgi:hypothetical protein